VALAPEDDRTALPARDGHARLGPDPRPRHAGQGLRDRLLGDPHLGGDLLQRQPLPPEPEHPLPVAAPGPSRPPRAVSFTRWRPPPTRQPGHEIRASLRPMTSTSTYR